MICACPACCTRSCCAVHMRTRVSCPSTPPRPTRELEGLQVPEHPVLARDKVCYVGQPVAVVVAQDRYLAKDALELLQVEYEPLPPLIDPVAAAQDSATSLHEAFGTNVAM